MKTIFTVLLLILHCQHLVSEYNVFTTAWIESGEGYQIIYPGQETAQVSPITIVVEDSPRFQYKVVCQRYTGDEYYSKVDILSGDGIIIDSLKLIDNYQEYCNERDLKLYITPQTPYEEGAKMIYLWKDEGKETRCKERSYYVSTMSMYGKVDRRQSLDVACPDHVTQFLNEFEDKVNVGVDGVAPDGFFYDMNFLDKRLIKLDGKIVKFPTLDSNGRTMNMFTFDCQKYEFTGPSPPPGYPTVFEPITYIGSVMYDDFVLERYKLRDCSTNEMSAEFINGENNKFKIYFQTTNQQCYGRQINFNPIFGDEFSKILEVNWGEQIRYIC